MDETKLAQAEELIRAGDKEGAMRILAPMVEAEPQNLKAWSLLVRCFSEKEKQIKIMEKCLGLNPGNKQVQAALDRLRGDPIDFEISTPAVKMKKCPYCAEMIRLDAKVCRYCGTDIEKRRKAKKWYMSTGVKIFTFLFFTPLWTLIIIEDPDSSWGLKVVGVILFIFYFMFICLPTIRYFF